MTTAGPEAIWRARAAGAAGGAETPGGTGAHLDHGALNGRRGVRGERDVDARRGVREESGWREGELREALGDEMERRVPPRLGKEQHRRRARRGVRGRRAARGEVLRGAQLVAGAQRVGVEGDARGRRWRLARGARRWWGRGEGGMRVWGEGW